jgi:hypothetical protein
MLWHPYANGVEVILNSRHSNLYPQNTTDCSLLVYCVLRLQSPIANRKQLITSQEHHDIKSERNNISYYRRNHSLNRPHTWINSSTLLTLSPPEIVSTILREGSLIHSRKHTSINLTPHEMKLTNHALKTRLPQ